MSASDLIRVARDDEYAGRVAMLQLTVAQQVASESESTPNHAARLDYSYLVIRGGENPKQVAAHVNTNATIAAAIASDPNAMGSNVSDNDISFTLSSIWDARSLAYAAGVAP